MPRRIDLNNALKIVLTLAATTLVAMALLTACVEKVEPCDKVDTFAEHWGGTDCPQVDTWATECASNLALMLPPARQDFDWCIDCYVLYKDDAERDCSEAPLGAACPALLNTTLDASCNWPIPVL